MAVRCARPHLSWLLLFVALCGIVARGLCQAPATPPAAPPAAVSGEVTQPSAPRVTAPLATPTPVIPLPAAVGVAPPPPSINDDTITRPSSALPGSAPSATPGAAATPVAPVVTPVPMPTVPPGPGTVSGAEPPRGSYRLESPFGVITNYERGISVAQGDVRLTYREFTVTGKRGLVDLNKNRATLSGDLTVTVRGHTFTGQTLTFDLDSGRWTLTQLQSEFPPDMFPPGTVLEPIFLHGGTVTGNDDALGGENFRFTTCDVDHYYILSHRIDFYRDSRGEPDRIVLRQNSLYVLGHKIMSLPVYVISLTGARSRRYGLQPTFGQNAVDGYFVRTLYNLDANAHHTDSLLLDALQKRGVGVGFQRELAQGAGLLYIYALSGQGSTAGRELDTKLQRAWHITPSLQSSINFQTTRNSAFGENTAAQNGDWSLLYTTSRIRSNLLVRYADSSSVGSEFQQLNASFIHQQQFSSDLNLDFSSLYARTNYTGLEGTATLDNTATLTRTGHLFDALLRAELHDDLTGANQRNGAYQLERLPELSLNSDTGRLRLPIFSHYLPGDVSFKFGDFNEPASLQRDSRADFSYGLRPQTFQVFRAGPLRSSLNVAGSFEQAFYSDDTARYTYNYYLNLKNSLGRRFSTQVNYFNQRTYGFTPFFFDFQPPGETIDASASYDAGKKFRLNVSTGRDLLNGFTRDVIGTLQLQPSRSFYASIGASYSPQTKTFGSITSNIRLQRSPKSFLGGNLDLGIRYSPEQGQLERINAAADIFVTGKTRVQALSSYDGFNKQFDLNQIRVTRDLHCFNLFVTYDQQQKQLRFDLALKALPFLDTRFGQSRQGEGFDPFVGQVQ
jgi:hypothetical protein